ncbi:MAG: threonylcarbamoyl-AMP synthase [Candidatus Obscuribacterales bacterium]|nr:threonylcarbamoyl-AMP synthase [Candidatus Obscuribacterales bacterium]
MGPSKYEIEEAMAVECLSRDNGVIVVPTDTTYGLVCRLDRLNGIERIYELKGRDRSKPLIILASDTKSILPFIDGAQEVVQTLGEKFWPGALTIVAKASARVPKEIMSGGTTVGVPKEIMSGGTTVGVRVPEHGALRALLALLPNGAVASTSANLSGAPTPKVMAEVIASLSDKVDYLMPDCGEPPAGTESTIIDVSGTEPRVLRAGALPAASLLSALSL